MNEDHALEQIHRQMSSLIGTILALNLSSNQACPDPSVADLDPLVKHLNSKFPGFSHALAIASSQSRRTEPISKYAQLDRREAALACDAERMIRIFVSPQTQTQPSKTKCLAESIWQDTKNLLENFHRKLWSCIHTTQAALDLLPIHGGTPSLLLAFADYAQTYSAQPQQSIPAVPWFEFLIKPECSQQSSSNAIGKAYSLLLSKTLPPLQSPSQIISIWRQKLVTADTFAYYMANVAQTRRVPATTPTTSDKLITAFSNHTLPSRYDSAAFQHQTATTPQYPQSLDDTTPALTRVFLALFTISSACHELRECITETAAPQDAFNGAVMNAFDRIAPQQSFSLLHMYPREVLAFRRIRLPGTPPQQQQHIENSVVEAILTTRWRARVVAGGKQPGGTLCGAMRYTLPANATQAIYETATTNYDDYEAAAVLDTVATYELYEKYFSPEAAVATRVCGPAGTAWQIVQVWKIARAAEGTTNTGGISAAIEFVEMLWKYMGVLHHSLAEILWVVGREFEDVDLVDLYTHFFF